MAEIKKEEAAYVAAAEGSTLSSRERNGSASYIKNFVQSGARCERDDNKTFKISATRNKNPAV